MGIMETPHTPITFKGEIAFQISSKVPLSHKWVSSPRHKLDPCGITGIQSVKVRALHHRMQVHFWFKIRLLDSGFHIYERTTTFDFHPYHHCINYYYYRNHLCMNIYIYKLSYNQSININTNIYLIFP